MGNLIGGGRKSSQLQDEEESDSVDEHFFSFVDDGAFSSADMSSIEGVSTARPPESAPKGNLVPQDFSKLMELKRKSSAKAIAARDAHTKKGVVVMKTKGEPETSRKTASIEVEGDTPPRGDVGATWEALEDIVVRETRDVKSTKIGVIQEGKQCTQLGPWRADTLGRLRMPIEGPKGAETWVTLDSRKCKNAVGEYGTLALRLVSLPSIDNNNVVKGVPVPAKNELVEESVEDWLDMVVLDDETEDNDTEQHMKSKNAKSAWRKEMAAKKEEIERLARQAREAEEEARIQNRVLEAKSILSETQKRSRNIKKKLRELEGKDGGGHELRIAQLKQEEKAVEAELFEDQEEERKATAQATLSNIRKRKKNKSRQLGQTELEHQASSLVEKQCSADKIVVAFEVIILVALFSAIAFAIRERLL